MLLDCVAATNWSFHTQDKIEAHLEHDESRKRYTDLMHALPPYILNKPLEIDINWNRFNKAPKGTKLLHYTIENKQPWYDPKHSFKDLWRDAFVSALKSGYITKEEVKVELNRFSAPSNCCRGEGLHDYWKKFLKV